MKNLIGKSVVSLIKTKNCIAIWTLSLAFSSGASAQALEHVLVTSSNYHWAFSGGGLDDILNSFIRTHDQFIMELDMRDHREEICDAENNLDLVECQGIETEIAAIQAENCSTHLLTPGIEVGVEASVGRLVGGSITLTWGGGSDIYEACIQSVNSNKEIGLLSCEADYYEESRRCLSGN